MSLDKSIVIVNEFTYKTQNGGTRGKSPRAYVMSYMARNDATEGITPVRFNNNEDFFSKYKRRKNVSDDFINNMSESRMNYVYDAVMKSSKKAGVAFANNNSSLSYSELKDKANLMQNMFDDGKVIFKTVISFEDDYLRENGLVDESFLAVKRGDFVGSVDQMKLRFAIMSGLDKMGKGFSDLQYVGVIQTDTRHLHVHLAMVDVGEGRLRYDGLQNGVLSKKDKKLLRRGINDYLKQKEKIKALTADIMCDRQNAVLYVKKFAHKTMYERGFFQFLVACLPENRNLWRASSNRDDMKKANFIVKNFVNEILSKPNSGYSEALSKIYKYADERMEREGLNENEYNKLVQNGKDKIVKDCMNSVYSVIKKIPKSELKVSTAFLNSMSKNLDNVSSEMSGIECFTYKLRTYSIRLKTHKEEYHKYRDEYNNYVKVPNKSTDSIALGNYLNIERMYNLMAMTKYQYFLSFLPSNEDFSEYEMKLKKKKKKLKNMKEMQSDNNFENMSEDVAYSYGKTMYDNNLGSMLSTENGRKLYQIKIEFLEEEINQEEKLFVEKLLDCGFSYDGNSVVNKKQYDFNEVKFVDLHHMQNDIEKRVSNENVEKFVHFANLRYNLFVKAKNYLINTNQSDKVSFLPESDVLLMKDFSDVLKTSILNKDDVCSLEGISLDKKYTYPKVRYSGSLQRDNKDNKTVSLSKDYSKKIENIVKESVVESVSNVELI